jgi:Cytochrome P460
VRLPLKAIFFLAAALCLSAVGCSRENPRVATALNSSAALAGPLPYNPLRWKVITSWIDKNDSTMSTLFGNDSAVSYARTSAQHNYPAGSILSLVTWNQRDDPRWFGAKIPAAPKSVEFVIITATPSGALTFSYQIFEGSPLKKVAAQQGSAPSDRASYLLSQRAAVMP